MTDSLKKIKAEFRNKNFNQIEVLKEIANNSKEQRINILSVLESDYQIKCLKLREDKQSTTHSIHNLFANNMLQKTVFEDTDREIMNEYINQIVVKEYDNDIELNNLYKFRKHFEIDFFEQACIKEMIPLNDLSYTKLTTLRSEGYNTNPRQTIQ